MSDFTKEELALGARLFDSQPDSPWTAFCELRELLGSMPLERRQELFDVVAAERAYGVHNLKRNPMTLSARDKTPIFALVRSTLDKLLPPGLTKAEATALKGAYDVINPPGGRPLTPLAAKLLPGELYVCLTPAEIAALQKTLEYVRITMGRVHSWEVRDTAMGAIGKILAAARTAQS